MAEFRRRKEKEIKRRRRNKRMTKIVLVIVVIWALIAVAAAAFHVTNGFGIFEGKKPSLSSAEETKDAIEQNEQQTLAEQNLKQTIESESKKEVAESEETSLEEKTEDATKASEAETTTVAASSEKAEDATAAGTEGGTLIVGFDQDFPPMGFVGDDGEYTGFDLELAQAVCDKEGWELVKKPINWDSKDMELNSGSIDCIWNGFTMNGREDDYTFSVPYVDNSQVIVVAEDSGIEQLSDLAGKTVGVQAASAALDLLQSEDEGGQKELADTFGSLNEFADYNTAFTELQAGALDALAIDVGVAKYQLAQREEGKYVILDEPIQSEQYGIGFAKGNDELKDTVWAEVLKLYDAGEVDKLAEKYEVADMLCIGDDDDTKAADAEETDDASEDEVAETDAEAEEDAE